MSDLERFLTRLGEDLNAIELELSDNLPRKIGDGRQYVHGIIVNGGSEQAVLKLFFRNNSQITTTLNAGQALELQSIPLAQIQNVQAGQNPNVVAYLATSSTLLGTPKMSVVGAPSVQAVSFNGVAQPVDVNHIDYTSTFNGYIGWYNTTITENGVVISVISNGSPYTGNVTVMTRSTTVIDVDALSGTSPSVSFQLYTYVSSGGAVPSNAISYANFYWVPLPNASTGTITSPGIYTMSVNSPLGGILLYATVGGTSPSITVFVTITAVYV